jgi:hypothetical protein
MEARDKKEELEVGRSNLKKENCIKLFEFFVTSIGT